MLREAAAHRALRRLAPAFAGMIAADWTVNIGLSVYAFDVGGAPAVGLVGFRFVPAALAGVLATNLCERYSRHRTLVWTPAIRAVLIAAAGAALVLGLPFSVALTLATVDAMVTTAYRPAQAALLPWLSRTPLQLANALAVLSMTKAFAQVAGALAGGVFVGKMGPAPCFFAVAGVLALVALVTVGVERDPPPARHETRLRRLGVESLQALRALARHRDAALITRLLSARSLVRGLWLALVVVATLEGHLRLGRSAVGAVWVATGAGALLSIPATFALVGRRSLAGPFAFSLLLFGLPVAAVAVFSDPVIALSILVFQGVGFSFSEVTSAGLLQRTVERHTAARFVGLIESVKLALEGLGVFLAPVLIAAVGVRGALLVTGLFLPAHAALEWRALRRSDARGQAREREVWLLRGVPIFRTLRLGAIERLAASLRPLRAAAGEAIVRQGEPGRLFYIVAAGEVDVTIDGHPVRTLEAGEGFGEIALLRSVARTATVTARDDVELYALDRDDFLPAVGGDGAADLVATERQTEADGTVVSTLAAVPLLEQLDRGELDRLADVATRVTIAKGSDVVREGDHGQRFYVLLSGRAEVLCLGEKMRELGPGDSFGEIAILRNVPRTATVRVTENATLCAVERDDLLRALRLDPRASEGMLAEHLVQ